MTLDILESILILLLVAVLVSAVFSRIKIPAIVGYIIVGVIVGPHVLGIIAERQDTKDIAEFGIVFLLFTIGLEFSLSRLMAMKKIVFGYGLLQVIFSMLITAIAGYFLHMTVQEIIVMGAVVAMSSTAIVSKQLTEQLEINSAQGINAIGILLLQDLAVIPILILIPSLVAIDAYSLSVNMLWALAKGFFAIVIILGFGRYLLRPVFYLIAKTKSMELFTLTVLLLAIACSWFTHEFGLSLAFGAFLAGMMLGETEFRHQIDADIRPFRDVLLALFFITIGMQMDWHILSYGWPWLLLLFFALVVFKFLLIYILGRLFKNDAFTACRTGLLLAQGGEFGFAILMLALNYKVIPDDYGQVVFGAILLSMVLSPFLILYNRQIAAFIFRKQAKTFEQDLKQKLQKTTEHLYNHIIICGYGRVGQNTARILEQAKLPFVAFDLDAKRVQDAALAGDKVFYADATHFEILKAANLQHAKAVVLCLHNVDAGKKVLQQIRVNHKHLPVIAMSFDEKEADELYELGSTEVIPETAETSLILASHVMLILKIPLHKIRYIIRDIRKHRYDLLRWVFPAQSGLNVEGEETQTHALHVLSLPETAYAVGKNLATLPLDKLDVRITRIRRGKKVISNPEPSFVLNTMDVIVFYGIQENLEQAESIFIKGN